MNNNPFDIDQMQQVWDMHRERTDGLRRSSPARRTLRLRRQNRRLAAAATLLLLSSFTVTSLSYSRPAVVASLQHLQHTRSTVDQIVAIV